MPKNNQKGFSPIAILLLIVLAGIIGFTGWYVYNAVQKNNNSEQTVGSQSQSQQVAAKNPTPTKAVGTASWKEYSNTKYAFFNFKYPGNSELDTNVNGAEYYLSVTVTPIDNVEDFTMGWTKENFNNDLVAIKKGDPTVKFGMTEEASYKIVSLKKGYGKKYTSLSGLDVCGANFSRSANLYIDKTLVHLTYRAGTDQSKIMAANPTYYTKSADCGDDTYVAKSYEQFAKFYSELEKGNTDSVSQKWFTDFDKILSTFNFE